MFPRNITRLTSNIIKKSPYTFDVLWSKGNLMLIEMNPKYPKYVGDPPDYDMMVKDGQVFEIKQIEPPNLCRVNKPKELYSTQNSRKLLEAYL